MSRFLIVCGGTGGHLAPGVAMAERLLERGHECRLVISRKDVDSALIRKYPGLAIAKAPGQALDAGWRRWPRAACELAANLLASARLIASEKPDAVLAFGGFLSFGAVVAARVARIPVVLHEANCRPGRTVRWLKRCAYRIYVPEGLRFRSVRESRVRHYGYPVRRDVRHVLKRDARGRMGVRVPHKLLVVIGGSQGARPLNRWLGEHVADLVRAGISVYCVTGMGEHGAAKLLREAEAYGDRVVCVPFSDEMGDVLSAADLVVSRAGAGSIAEIVHCRAPSILVPFPRAADDHQLANARGLERRGACVVVPQERLDALQGEVKDLIFNDWLLSRFKANMERMEQDDPADLIVRDLEGIVGGAKADSNLQSREVPA